MSKRAEQIFDDLLVEYADENLQVRINNDLLSDLKINKAALTRFANQWLEQKRAKWIGTNTLQLIINDDSVESEEVIKEKNEEAEHKSKNEASNENVLPDMTTNLKIRNDVNLPNNLTNIIIELIEGKFEIKLTKEMHLLILNNVTKFEIWERTFKNILYNPIPDYIVNDYLNYVLKEKI